MTQVLAENYMPKFSNSIKYFGEGAFYAPKTLKIYQKPDENSQVVETINMEDNELKSEYAGILKASESTLAFLPDKNIILFAVVEDCKDWSKIVYNQTNGDSGWVKISENAKYYDWKDLFNKYGRKNGMYLWSNTPKENQVLRTEPDINSQPNNEFIYPQIINLKLLRGNWMLIEIIDIDNIPKVGWFQWRTSEGNLLLFPKLTKPSI